MSSFSARGRGWRPERGRYGIGQWATGGVGGRGGQGRGGGAGLGLLQQQRSRQWCGLPGGRSWCPIPPHTLPCMAPPMVNPPRSRAPLCLPPPQILFWVWGCACHENDFYGKGGNTGTLLLIHLVTLLLKQASQQCIWI